MTDLMDLLDSAAGRPAAPTAQTVGDDLRRGRRALLHRRWARGGAVLVTGAAVAGALAVAGPSSPSTTPSVQAAAGGGATSAQPSAGTEVTPAAGPAVALVPAGTDDKGQAFTAALGPEGWRMQDSEFVLAFEPPGTDTTVNDFQDKLVVMLAGDSRPAPGARHLEIGGGDAATWTEGDTATYYLVGPGGDARPLVVQVPAALGWDDATLTRFAEGLAVGPGAQAGRG